MAVPADVDATSARVWVGCTVTHPADPARVRLRHVESGAEWPVGSWQQWTVPGEPDRFIKYQRVRIGGLRADSRYRLTLHVDGEPSGAVDIWTLPERLPSDGEPPFVVLFGSCFCRMQDAGGLVGRAFAQLPGGSKPRLKFLLGDQVYLDSPWYRFLTPHRTSSLGRGFLEHYLATWAQRSDGQGFSHLLSSGANYFCADDHEFWNNAPFPSGFAVDTWRRSGRRAWWAHASALYAAFQATSSFATIDVGPLSIAVLDTRVNRGSDRTAFASAADLDAVERWIRGLASPGLLVVGQPLFATRAGVMGRFTDWNLPDFDQYARLCRALLDSRQSIVVVTGDVHYGRVATASLRSGAELVEVISSPMALVDRTAGGRWHAAPGRFPAEPIPGIASVPVTTDAAWSRFANHFITMELTARGGGLAVRVRSWETQPADGVAAGEVVAERFLKRVA